MGRRKTLAWLTAAALLVAPQAAWAQGPLDKMGRGVVNVLTGWLELFKQFSLGKQEPNPVTGIAMGLVRGASLTLLRTGVGLYETVSFPVPYPQDYASPYEGMELPDYAWE